MEFNECSTPALKKTFVVPNWYWPVVIPPATILRWCNRWPVMSLYCRSSSASLRMSAMAWLCFLHTQKTKSQHYMLSGKILAEKYVDPKYTMWTQKIQLAIHQFCTSVTVRILLTPASTETATEKAGTATDSGTPPAALATPP